MDDTPFFVRTSLPVTLRNNVGRPLTDRPFRCNCRSYHHRWLQISLRNPSDTTDQLLSQILQQLSDSAAGFEPPAPFLLPKFDVPPSKLRVNILWFFSLSLSIACALSATLVQQLVRNCLLTTQFPSSPQHQTRVRAYLFQGALSFQLGTIVNAVPSVFHVSVVLFFASLVEFLFLVNHTLAYVVLG